MILVDDLLVRPFVTVLDAIHTVALRERYDIDGIQDALKENQLLYDLGERSEAEYERRKQDLQAELEVARQAHEQLEHKRIEVRGA